MLRETFSGDGAGLRCGEHRQFEPGKAPLFEPGLNALLTSGIAAGKFLSLRTQKPPVQLIFGKGIEKHRWC
jgi:hypothetical protein